MNKYAVIHILRVTIILLFSLLLPGSLFIANAQQTRTFSKPFLEFKDNTLLISYNFPEDCKASHRVRIEIKDSKGNSIDPHTLYGDIGDNIAPGKNKLISWDLGRDSISLNEPVSVRVLAQQMPEFYSKANLILSSALLPGLGQSKLSGKPYWLAGVAAYSCLAGSYWLNRKAADNYQLYLDSDVKSENDDYFNITLSQNNTSRILAWSSLAVWTANLVWMAVMPDNRLKSKDTGRMQVGLKPASHYFGSNFSFYLTLNLAR